MEVRAVEHDQVALFLKLLRQCAACGFRLGLNIQGVIVYVKVSLRLEPARCLCVSFHEATSPMSLPYRNDQKRRNDR